MVRKETIEAFNTYMNDVRSAATLHCRDGGIYAGADGCKRFAREVGYALLDFTKDEKEMRDLASRTYSGICVISYRLNPPINSKEWLKSMHDGIKRRIEYDSTRKVFVPSEDYMPVQTTYLDSVEVYKSQFIGRHSHEE